MLKKQLIEKSKQQNEIHPLSFGQKALYFIYLNSPENTAYNVAFTSRIVSAVNINALRKSFQKLVNRHPSLRTSYRIENGEPVQEVHGYQEVYFEETDVSDFPEEKIKQEVVNAYSKPFNLETGPVFKVYLFGKSQSEFILLINTHHIATDGWSIGLMLNELKTFYENEITGIESTLPLLKNKYSDFVKWQSDFIKTESGESMWKYWESELGGELPVLNLPADRQRPALQSLNGSTEYFRIDNAIIEEIKKLSQKEGATLFVALLTAYQILLHKYNSQEEIIVGIPTAGRNSIEFESIAGYFINPVAIKGTIKDELTFKEILSQIRKKVLNAISNQDFPFPVIVERLLKSRDPSRTPVFQTFFGLQKVPKGKDIQEIVIPGNKDAKINFGKLEIAPFEISQQEGQFDLLLEFFEGENIFSGVLKYNSDIFGKKRMKRLCIHFNKLLSEILKNPGGKISSFNILTKDESDEIAGWNNTEKKYDTGNFIHQLFALKAKESPEAVAAVIEDRKLTYKELDAITNKLANYLIRKGHKPDMLAGVYIERSLEMIISLLAIMKAGGAYVPIDPSYPKERSDFMIEDSGIKFLLTTEELGRQFQNKLTELIFVDTFENNHSSESDTVPDVKTESDNLAYMIYTSGSTGKPKGAMNTHGGILNRLLWMKEYLKVTADDVIFQKTSFSFDVSVWEFFLPLISGAKLVFAKPEGHKDPDYLAEEIQNKKITVMHFVPSMLQIFLEGKKARDCTSLKKVICSGEELSYNLQKKFFDTYKEAELHNLYGPTEAAVDVTYWKCDRNSSLGFIPIGKPVANTKLYILDANQKLLPPGIPGELCIGGVQVARGYLNRDELTAEKFIPDAYSENKNDRLYRTGDLARFLDDGNIEYLGRIDNQIKIRGFRIELGEIEFALNAIDGIKESVVIAKEIRQGDKRLIAFVVLKDGKSLTTEDIRTRLKEKLPDYMIPAQIIYLDKIPLSHNGKADRKALYSMEFSRDELKKEFKEAEKPAEEILAKIWKEVLSLDKVGVNDNFFELGGDSIISIQIIFKAGQHGLKITPKQIFQYQTIAELAQVVEQLSETETSREANQGSEEGEIPLTPIQHWFFNQNLPSPQHFNHTVLMKVPKNLNQEFLKKAAEEILKHHDALRAEYSKTESGWKQSYSQAKNEMLFSSVDFKNKDKEFIGHEIEKDISSLHTQTDLQKSRLIFFRHYTAPDGIEDKLLILVHHLVIDGISWRILLEDFYTAYTSLTRGEKVNLPVKTLSYKNWSLRLSGYPGTGKLTDEEQVLDSLNEFQITPLPEDFKQGVNNAGSAETIHIELSEENTKSLLKEVSAAYNTQINDILLTALIISFNKWSGSNRLFLNLESHGREELIDNLNLSRTVGWFTAIFPLMLEINNPDDTEECIKTVKEALRKISHNGIGFGILRYLSKSKDVRDKFKNYREPEVVFNYLGQINEKLIPESDWVIGNEMIKLSQDKEGIRSHKLEINGAVFKGKLEMNFTFSKNIFKKETIENVADIFRQELENIITHCKETEVRKYTPSDFSAAGLDQQDLDKLLENLNL